MSGNYSARPERHRLEDVAREFGVDLVSDDMRRVPASDHRDWIDLDRLLEVAERTEHWGYKDDVPVLVAEVQRLRAQVERLTGMARRSQQMTRVWEAEDRADEAGDVVRLLRAELATATRAAQVWEETANELSAARGIVPYLDAIDTEDPERAHGLADAALLEVVPAEVREAYQRVVSRSRYWAAS